LRLLGTQIETVMRQVPGVVDLAREQQSDIPFLRVHFDRVAIARHGMRIADAARALESASGVHSVSLAYSRAVRPLSASVAPASPIPLDLLAPCRPPCAGVHGVAGLISDAFCGTDTI
jgi:hypothetical protein